jgi:hypothetical protein
VPQEGMDEFAPYREKRKVIDMNHLEKEEPTLYERLTKDEPPIFRQDTIYWHNGMAKRYNLDKKDMHKLRQYIESSPSSLVRFKNMPRELADEWKNKADELLSAWYNLPYEKHKEICRSCTIRPIDEDNCYIRFSNYPGMDIFRHGFALTVLYSIGIDEDRLKESYFSFPHLNKENKQLPKDKIAELFEMCKDAPINRGAEVLFNNVVEMLEKMKPDDVTTDMNKLNIDPMPFIDDFVSMYIYREKPISLEDTKKVIPYLETLMEVADWAIWDTNNENLRRPIIAFKNKFQRLITALTIADRYGLEVSMSY